MASLELSSKEPPSQTFSRDATNVEEAATEPTSEKASNLTTSDNSTIIEDNADVASINTKDKSIDLQQAKKLKAKEKKKRHEKRRKARRKAENKAQGDTWVPLTGKFGQQNGGAANSNGETCRVVVGEDDEDVDEVVPSGEAGVGRPKLIDFEITVADTGFEMVFILHER